MYRTPHPPGYALKQLVALIAGLGGAMSNACLQAAEVQIFTLGEIQVVATPSGQQSLGATQIDLEDIRQHNRETVGAALDMLPGVTISKTGARNEQTINVRGFDLRQVPVFIDGIPIYVPYDGYVDLGRFTTFDLSRIEVAKGFSSMVYGPNTMGGAINLISRRPASRFEGEVGGGFTLDATGRDTGYRLYTNLGTNQGMWYAQLGLSYLEQAYYRLPAGYAKTPGEDGGHRDNSYNDDRKVNLKLGLTPNATDEYSLNYINQHGAKGNPPYAGTVPGVALRYWQWPYWDKESVYLLTNTAFGEHYVKLRAYHDVFKNSLFSYDSASYTTQRRPYAFQSWYDDYTNGASIEAGFRIYSGNQLKAAYHLKEDVHREHNLGEPVRRFRDQTQSFNLEDSQQLTQKLSLIGGLGYDVRETREAEDYNSTTRVVSNFRRDTNDAFNAQLGLLYRTSDTGRLQGSIAKKSRFPTIKERYSYRMGTAVPNAELRTEQAIHYEIGYSERIGAGLFGDIRLYYSDIDDLIQQAVVPSPLCGGSTCFQNQNVSKATSTGMDVEIRGELLRTIDFVGAYGYMERRNRSNDGLFLTDSPRHKLFTALTWHATGAVALTASANGMSSRYSSSDGKQLAGAFAIANLKASYRFAGGASVEAGVYNLFDRLYAISEGYPEAGRTFFTNFNLPL